MPFINHAKTQIYFNHFQRPAIEKSGAHEKAASKGRQDFS